MIPAKPPPAKTDLAAGSMTMTPTENNLLALPPELRNVVLKNLNEVDLADVAQVSRQCRLDCSDPSLPQTRTAIIRCRPSAVTDPTMLSMQHMTNPLVPVLLRIQAASCRFTGRFTGVQIYNHKALPKITAREAKPIIKNLKLPLVTHLDMSFPEEAKNWTEDEKQMPPSVAKIWSQIMPNLTDVNLDRHKVGANVLADFSRNCPKLDKLEFRHGIFAASVSGFDLNKCEHLKQLLLDNTAFATTEKEGENMFEDPDHEACPFSLCLENLERASLKKAKYFNSATNTEPKAFTQIGLMKFVRAAKRLRWFRSDLSAKNIAILKEERPEITFTN
jgi:hypothetical protein